jgi:hypothetical protein
MKTETEIKEEWKRKEETINNMKASGLKTWHWEYYQKALKWVLECQETGE